MLQLLACSLTLLIYIFYSYLILQEWQNVSQTWIEGVHKQQVGHLHCALLTRCVASMHSHYNDDSNLDP